MTETMVESLTDFFEAIDVARKSAKIYKSESEIAIILAMNYKKKTEMYVVLFVFSLFLNLIFVFYLLYKWRKSKRDSESF